MVLQTDGQQMIDPPAADCQVPCARRCNTSRYDRDKMRAEREMYIHLQCDKSSNGSVRRFQPPLKATMEEVVRSTGFREGQVPMSKDSEVHEPPLLDRETCRVCILLNANDYHAIPMDQS
jgi:putative lipase involved disintegration of autophagic bodies